MLQQGIGHRFDRPPVPLQQTVGALPLAGERASPHHRRWPPTTITDCTGRDG